MVKTMRVFIIFTKNVHHDGNDDNENESEYKEKMIVERYSYSLIVQFIKYVKVKWKYFQQILSVSINVVVVPFKPQ